MEQNLGFPEVVDPGEMERLRRRRLQAADQGQGYDSTSLWSQFWNKEFPAGISALTRPALPFLPQYDPKTGGTSVPLLEAAKGLPDFLADPFGDIRGVSTPIAAKPPAAPSVPAPEKEAKKGGEAPPAPKAEPTYAYKFPEPVAGPAGIGTLPPSGAGFTMTKEAPLPNRTVERLDAHGRAFPQQVQSADHPIDTYRMAGPSPGDEYTSPEGVKLKYATSDQVLEQALAAAQNRDSSKAAQLMGQLAPGWREAYAAREASPDFQRSLGERERQSQLAEGERGYVARQKQDFAAQKEKALGFADSYPQALDWAAKRIHQELLNQLESDPKRQGARATPQEAAALLIQAKRQAPVYLQDLLIRGTFPGLYARSTQELPG